MDAAGRRGACWEDEDDGRGLIDHGPRVRKPVGWIAPVTIGTAAGPHMDAGLEGRAAQDRSDGNEKDGCKFHRALILLDVVFRVFHVANISSSQRAGLTIGPR